MHAVIIPIFALLIPMVIVPTALGLKHARFLREMEHTERMRALELGRRLPQDEVGWTPARICVAIGAGVPVGVFFCAWMASQAIGYHEEVWTMAGGVGITAVICGSVLAGRHFTQHARAGSGASLDDMNRKEPLDADAYDVVGSRG
jgi:hypothetical protein